MENANKLLAQQLDNVYNLMLQNTSNSTTYSNNFKNIDQSSLNNCSAIIEVESSIAAVPNINNALSQLRNIPALEIRSLKDLNISKVIEKWFQCGMESKKNYKTNNWSTLTADNTRDKVSRVIRYCLDEVATENELQILKNGVPPANASNYFELKTIYTDTCYSIERNAVSKLQQLTSVISANSNKRKSPVVNIALVSAVCKKLDAVSKHSKNK